MGTVGELPASPLSMPPERRLLMQKLMLLRSPIAVAAAIAGALVAAVVGVNARPPAATAAVAAADDLRPTVQVVGDGRVLVQPDVANITLGVEANGQTLAAAQADAATR